jgi:hypothetical protein
MKTRLFLCLVLAGLIFLACNKDKFQTKPTIEVKSLSTKEVPAPNGTMDVRLTFTDKEGDLGTGILTYIRVRTNGTPIPNPGTYDKIDTIRTPIPDFPVKNKGEIDIHFDYNFMDEDPNRNDTMFFKITVMDLEGNTSDTISTPLVVARQI